MPMWSWLGRQRMWPFRRPPRSVRVGYEKAGLIVYDQPIPWNADVIRVEAQMPLRSDTVKSELHLVLPGLLPIEPFSVRLNDEDGHYDVVFRFRPLGRALIAVLLWRDTLL